MTRNLLPPLGGRMMRNAVKDGILSQEDRFDLL